MCFKKGRIPIWDASFFVFFYVVQNEDVAMRLIVAFAPLVLLAGCGAEPTTNSVDTVTPAEAEALNDAAEMLDQTEPPPRLTQDKGNVPVPPVPGQ
jgi:hypothetical protein